MKKKEGNRKLFILSFVCVSLLFLSSFLVNDKNFKFGSNSKAADVSNAAAIEECTEICVNKAGPINEGAGVDSFFLLAQKTRCQLECKIITEEQPRLEETIPVDPSIDFRNFSKKFDCSPRLSSIAYKNKCLTNASLKAGFSAVCSDGSKISFDSCSDEAKLKEIATEMCNKYTPEKCAEIKLSLDECNYSNQKKSTKNIIDTWKTNNQPISKNVSMTSDKYGVAKYKKTLVHKCNDSLESISRPIFSADFDLTSSFKIMESSPVSTSFCTCNRVLNVEVANLKPSTKYNLSMDIDYSVINRSIPITIIPTRPTITPKPTTKPGFPWVWFWPTQTPPKPPIVTPYPTTSPIAPTVIPAPTYLPTPMPTIQSSNQPYFEFQPTSSAIRLDTEYKVSVLLNSFQGVEISSVDMMVKYDSTKLYYVGITPSNVFEKMGAVNNSSSGGNLYIFGINNDAQKVFNTPGKTHFVTLIFRPIDLGTTKLTFNCSQGATNDSNIIRNSSYPTDLINCSKNNESAVSIF